MECQKAQLFLRFKLWFYKFFVRICTKQFHYGIFNNYICVHRLLKLAQCNYFGFVFPPSQKLRIKWENTEYLSFFWMFVVFLICLKSFWWFIQDIQHLNLKFSILKSHVWLKSNRKEWFLFCKLKALCLYEIIFVL